MSQRKKLSQCYTNEDVKNLWWMSGYTRHRWIRDGCIEEKVGSNTYCGKDSRISP